MSFLRGDEVYILMGKGGHKDLAETKDLGEVFMFDLDDMHMKEVEVMGQQDWMKGSNFTGLPLNHDLFFMLG